MLDAGGVPEIVDRSAEIHALWQASVAAAGGEDSALAVRLADDAIMAGRPARLTLQLARVAMHWARLDFSPIAESDQWAEAATRVFASTAGSHTSTARASSRTPGSSCGRDDAVRAGELATSALDLVHDAPGTAPAEAHLVLATVALALDADMSRPLGEARQLLETLNRPVFGSDRQAARCWRELGDLFGGSGDKAQQTSAYRKALEAAGVHSALSGVKIDVSVNR